MARMYAAAPPSNTAPLWSRARAMFARAMASLGGAAAIAAIATLNAVLRRSIMVWLAPLEHVVRKLLLADAAQLQRAAGASAQRHPRLEHVPLNGIAQTWTAGLQTGSCAGVKQPCASENARTKTDLAHPETWRAPFSFALPRDPCAAAHAPHIRASLTAPAPREAASCVRDDADSAFRLARRFEALRRVLENPRPHAERLAGLLARAVRRFRQVVQRYVVAPCRSNDYDPGDARLSLDAMEAAFAAPTAFPPDSS